MGNRTSIVKTKDTAQYYLNNELHRCGTHGVDSDLPTIERVNRDREVRQKWRGNDRCYGPRGVDNDFPVIDRVNGNDEVCQEYELMTNFIVAGLMV